MKGRIFSTVTLWAIVAATAVIFKAEGAVWLTALAALLTQHELYKMLSLMGQRPMTLLGLAAGLGISLSPMFARGLPVDGMDMVAPAVILFSVVALMRKPRGNPVHSLGSTLLGLLLAPCTMLFLSLMIYRFGPDGKGLLMVLWVVMAAKFTDMGALVIGLAIGKHKMAPILSPKKSWEGAVGGVVVSVGCSAAYAVLLANYLPAAFTPGKAAIMAFPISLAAIFADLLESSFKRESGVKDSGKALPGIGGFFDLTDSFMLAAPLAYYLAVFML